jgi:hypothetical protein
MMTFGVSVLHLPTGWVAPKAAERSTANDYQREL